MWSRQAIQPLDTIAQLLAAQQAAWPPGERAISFYDGPELRTTLTSAQYLGRVSDYAAYLQGLGIVKGDRVATLFHNRIEVPMLYLAAMSIGAVVVPLNPSYAAAEMQFVLHDAGAVGVVTDHATGDGRYAEFAALRFVSFVDDIELDVGMRPAPVELHGDDPAITLYTSGTTSFPKGVVQMHRNLIANAWSMVKAFGIDRPVQYSVMPFYHAHAVGFGMMTCLLTQGHLIVAPRMDPLSWSQVIEAEQVTVTSMVPNLLHMLLRAGVRRAQVPSLRFVFVSAAPLPSELARRFEAESGIRIAHAWGLSEYTNFATALAADFDPVGRERLMFGHPVPSVGHPLDGVHVWVQRPDGSRADAGELGELCVSGPSLTLGYHRNPEATQAAMGGGFLRSGDEGFFEVVDGRPFFYITDRIKDVIIRSGEKISPAGVEHTILQRLPQLANRIVALGFPHDTYGEEVGLVVETTGEGVVGDELVNVLKAMPVRMRPKVVLHGEDIIPRTHTGKIQRRMLRPRFAAFQNRALAMHIAPAEAD